MAHLPADVHSGYVLRHRKQLTEGVHLAVLTPAEARHGVGDEEYQLGSLTCLSGFTCTKFVAWGKGEELPLSCTRQL